MSPVQDVADVNVAAVRERRGKPTSARGLTAGWNDLYAVMLWWTLPFRNGLSILECSDFQYIVLIGQSGARGVTESFDMVNNTFESTRVIYEVTAVSQSRL